MYVLITLCTGNYFHNRFLLFSLFMPIIQTALFNEAIGKKPKDLELGVVNEEISTNDCNQYADSGCFFDPNPNANTSLSCALLQYIRDKKYKLVSCVWRVLAGLSQRSDIARCYSRYIAAR